MQFHLLNVHATLHVKLFCNGNEIIPGRFYSYHWVCASALNVWIQKHTCMPCTDILCTGLDQLPGRWFTLFPIAMSIDTYNNKGHTRYRTKISIIWQIRMHVFFTDLISM